MTKLGDMFHIPVTDRLNKRRPCVQKTIGRSGTLFCHFLLILVQRVRISDLYVLAYMHMQSRHGHSQIDRSAVGWGD
jgi:hypothetical protein